MPRIRSSSSSSVRSLTLRAGAPAALLALTLGGCAGIATREAGHPGPAGNVVSVAEPPTPPGPAEPEVAEPSLADDAVLAAARLVANEGRVPRAVHWDGWFAGGCGPAADGGVLAAPMLVAGDVSPLNEWDAFPRGLFVGVALDADGVTPVAWGWCGWPGLMEARASRVARLAPEVTGRDTSLLFTTGRAGTRTPAATALATAAARWLVPAAASASGGPRTAKPRGTSETGRTASTAAPAPAAATTPAASPPSKASAPALGRAARVY